MILLWIILFLFSTNVAQANTRLALHVTSDELAIWNQRRISGPYLDDWNRIISRADSFKSNPSQGVWPGNQVNIAWEGDKIRDDDPAYGNTYYPCGSPSNPSAGSRSCADYVRDAGFLYLLTGDTSYRDPVRTFLLNHANNNCALIGSSGTACGVDFTNTTKWRTNYRDQDQDFQITVWLRKVTYAYSYIRNSLGAADKTIIDTWLLGAGRFWDKVCDNEIKAVYPNRDSNNYSGPGVSDAGMTHYNGWMVQNSSDVWESKQTMHAASAAAIAVVVADATLKANAKKFVKEWLRFRVFSDGTVGDQARWVRFGTTAGPGNGYHYVASAVGHIVSIIDHLARDGDSELYTYSTTLGNGLTGIRDTSGGPKNIMLVLRRIANMAFHNVDAYGSTDSNLTECKRIDFDVQNCGYSTEFQIVHDFGLAQGNLFSPDLMVKQLVERPAFSNPSSGGYDPFGGAYGHLPGARFMFGQMENIVNPYIPLYITWSNARTGESGNATTCCASWTISSIPLLPGLNPITVTATDSTGNVGTDQITVNYQPTFPGNALVGAWGFEDGKGNTTVDSSNAANNGILVNNPTWAGTSAGKFGNALSFNGTTNYVSVPDSNSLDLNYGFTFSAWVQTPVGMSDYRAVIVKNYVQFLYGSVSGNCGNGSIYAGLIVNDTTLYYNCNITPLQINQWTHLAMTYDGAFLRLYRDGVEQLPATPATGLMGSTTGNLTIGVSDPTWTPPEFFRGLIDEVRVYNFAIPRTAGTNATPGVPCGDKDYTATVKASLNYSAASIVGDMNCPVIPQQAGPTPIPPTKLGVSSSALKLGVGAAAFKMGTGQ